MKVVSERSVPEEERVVFLARPSSALPFLFAALAVVMLVMAAPRLFIEGYGDPIEIPIIAGGLFAAASAAAWLRDGSNTREIELRVTPQTICVDNAQFERDQSSALDLREREATSKGLDGRTQKRTRHDVLYGDRTLVGHLRSEDDAQEIKRWLTSALSSTSS